MIEGQTQRNYTTVGAALLTMAVGLTIVGCGADTGGRVPLAGQVTLDGTPLDRGTIEFHSSGGGSVSGGAIRDGRFEIPAAQGVTPGSYEVRIYSASESGEVANPDEPPGPEAERQVAQERIPARYNTQSELTTQVGEDGATDLKFDLES